MHDFVWFTSECDLHFMSSLYCINQLYHLFM
nr:MAG TPA: hypothetical protein [Caudoviricetes sp.]